jgi:hypothetical protein
MEIGTPEIQHRVTRRIPVIGLVYKMKKATMKHRRKNNNKVSMYCTQMLPYGNLAIDPLEHQGSLSGPLQEKRNHMLGLTAINRRPQSITIMMLQESKLTKTTAVFEQGKFTTNKVNLPSIYIELL